MNLRNRINLIPRNNWDYSFTALFTALAGINHQTGKETQIGNIFHQQPIWTNSGRTSLYTILKSLDLPQGAKVGVPLFCCSVVFNAICQAGLTPCFIDSNTNDCNIAVEDLQKKRADLAALVAVHMFGNPCDMDELVDVADSIPVIEDCAQSILSIYKGKPTGVLASASFFSFRCGKYISAGEGSAIFCKEPELKSKIDRLVNSYAGWSPRQQFTNTLATFVKAGFYNRPWYGLLGYPIGMRLDNKLNLTAKEGFKIGGIAPNHQALIEKRIPSFQEKIDIQRAHAHFLLGRLLPHNYHLPSENDGCYSNWFQFPLRFNHTHQRDSMAAYLFEQGIDTAKYLDDIVSEASSTYGYAGDCPNAELFSKTILLVPIHYTLRHSDIDRIARSINNASQSM